MANSRSDAAEAKSSRLRKDLVEVMDQVNDAKAKPKEVSDQLRIEKILVVQKDEEIQLMKLMIGNEHEKAVDDFQASEAFRIIAFDECFKGFKLLRGWMVKQHTVVVNYSDLDFEAVHKDMVADEDAERARADKQVGVEGERPGNAQAIPLDDPPAEHPIDLAADLVVNPAI